MFLSGLWRRLSRRLSPKIGDNYDKHDGGDEFFHFVAGLMAAVNRPFRSDQSTNFAINKASAARTSAPQRSDVRVSVFRYRRCCF